MSWLATTVNKELSSMPGIMPDSLATYYSFMLSIHRSIPVITLEPLFAGSYHGDVVEEAPAKE